MNPRTQWDERRRTWSPPEELRRCRPREVRLSAAGRTLQVLTVILLAGGIAAGIILFVKASNDHDERRQIQANGQDTFGQVVRRWVTRKDPHRYLVEYTFQASENSVKGRVEVGPRGWNQMLPGTSLPVRYLSGNPNAHLVIGHEPKLMPLWLPYPIAGALALAAFLIAREIRRQRRLLAEGRPAPALIIRHEGSQHGKVVHYEFPLMSGALVRGKAGPQKKPPALGSILCVLYEPDRAGNNSLYPLTLVRPVHGSGLKVPLTADGRRLA